MTTPNPRLVSLNIGEPKQLGVKPDGSPFISSIARQPVAGPVRLGQGGFENDACYWSSHHSAPMAVNVFATEDYPYFEELAGKTLPRPAFGENLTMEGYADRAACVGDVLRVGGALLQVSQPRIPCGNLVRFLGLPRVMRWMEEDCRTGFYLQVLEPGEVRADSPIELVKRVKGGWTIAALSEVMFARRDEKDLVEAVLEVEELSPLWKSSLIRMVGKEQANNPKGAKISS